MFPTTDSIMSDAIAGLIVSALAFAISKARPYLRSSLSGLWRRIRPGLAADYAAAKSAPVWRKVLAGMTLVWGGGGMWAFIGNGGIDAAPLWILLWFGTTSGFVWSYGVWLAIHWAVSKTRRPLA